MVSPVVFCINSSAAHRLNVPARQPCRFGRGLIERPGMGGLLLIRFEARIIKMGGSSHGSQAENRRTALGDLKDG